MKTQTRAVDAPQVEASQTRRAGAQAPKTASDVLAMQQLIGNHAVQAKLMVGPVDDPFEREADAVAEAVMTSPPAGGVQREGVAEPEEDELQRQPFVDATPNQETFHEKWEKAEKPPSTEDQAKEAMAKIGEALMQTKAGKQFVSFLKKQGAAFWATMPGKAVVITLGSATAVGLYMSDQTLPIQLPDLPLDFVLPGLSAKLDIQGPLNQPTGVMLTLTFEPKAKSVQKSKRSESDALKREMDYWHEQFNTPEQKAMDKEIDRYLYERFIREVIPIKRKGSVQRKSSDSGELDEQASQGIRRVLQSDAQPLDAATRDFLEPRFGRDFGDVRVHTDSQAQESATAINAKAYTIGSDVVFGTGQYAPQTTEGRKLIAHELTHVVQQRRSSTSIQAYPDDSRDGGVSLPGGIPETEAEAASHREAARQQQEQSDFAREAEQRQRHEEDLARQREQQRLRQRAIGNWDVALEQIAHRLVYKTTLTDQDIQWLDNFGFTTETREIRTYEGDLQMLSLKGRRRGDGTFTPNVLAFRGTKGTPDLNADAVPEGVGMYQFTANQADIRRELTHLRENSLELITCGHSLGGALAQITASTFPDLVNRVVTFQSPGIPRHKVERLLRFNQRHPNRSVQSRHHRVRGDIMGNDIVEEAGESLTPGVSFTHEYIEGAPAGLPKHYGYPLASTQETEFIAQSSSPSLPGSLTLPHRGQTTGQFEVESEQIESGANRHNFTESARFAAGIILPSTSFQFQYVRVWSEIERMIDANRAANVIVEQLVGNSVSVDVLQLVSVTKSSIERMLKNLGHLYPAKFPTALVQNAVQRLDALYERAQRYFEQIRTAEAMAMPM